MALQSLSNSPFATNAKLRSLGIRPRAAQSTELALASASPVSAPVAAPERIIGPEAPKNAGLSLSLPAAPTPSAGQVATDSGPSFGTRVLEALDRPVVLGGIALAMAIGTYAVLEMRSGKKAPAAAASGARSKTRAASRKRRSKGRRRAA